MSAQTIQDYSELTDDEFFIQKMLEFNEREPEIMAENISRILKTQESKKGPENMEQVLNILETREAENMKLSLVLRSKDMDIELLNHALKLEKERTQYFSEYVDRAQKSCEKAQNICMDLFSKLETAHEDYALMKKERDELLLKLSKST